MRFINRRSLHITSPGTLRTSRASRPLRGAGSGVSRRFFPLLLLLATALLVVPPPILPQDDADGQTDEDRPSPPGSALPEEDPPELFDVQVGDTEADVFVQGRWESAIAGALGIALLSEPVDDSRVAFPYTFPGMDPTPFVNTVDLTISIWLFEHYYLEATVLDELELGTLVFGYEGGEDAFVKRVRLGSDTFDLTTAAPAPYLTATEGEEPALGGYILAQSETASHELLLQYRGAEAAVDLYRGLNLLTEETIDPAAYLRGRYFVLPDGGVEDLTVYIEDAQGAVTASDGRTYREARPGPDVRTSPERGTVSLTEPAAGRVLVTYTKEGNRVGDPALGRDALVYTEGGRPVPGAGEPLDFSFRDQSYLDVNLSNLEVTVDGEPALLLYDPVAFSPFEAQNRYAVNGGSESEEDSDDAAGTTGGDGSGEVEIRFQRRASARDLALPGLRPLIAEGVVVIEDAVAGVDEDPRAAANRYPFAATEPAYPDLYGPAPTTKEGASDFVIARRSLTEVSAVTLPQRVVPGSVQITRNGLPEYGYSLDPATGEVTFVTPVSPLDRIEVRYRLEAPGAAGGDATLAYGNRIDLGGDATLRTVLGGAVPLPRGGYTTTSGERPASTTAAGRLTWQRDRLTLESDIAAELRIPDATGHLRLAGMEEHVTAVPVSDPAMVPAAPPEDALAEELALLGEPALPEEPALEATNRGELRYRDYYFESIFGTRTLQDYRWTVPPEQVFAYEEGSRTGPYPVAAREDGFTAPVMALDFVLEEKEATATGGPSWAGGRLQLPPGEQDLSTAEGLRLSWKRTDTPSPEGEVAVYLIAGPTSEDTDADGRLDAGSGVLDPRYSFTDDRRDITLEAGAVEAGIGPAVTEDGNRNGILDAAAPVVTRRLAAKSSDIPDTWESVEFTFSEAERRRLAATRSVDIVVVNTGAGSARGRILVGDVEFQRSGATLDPRDGDITARERRVADLGDTAGTTGTGGEALAEVRERFTDVAGEPERLLDVDWESLDGAAWTLEERVAPTTPGSYEELVLFVRPVALSADATLTIELSDHADARLTASIPLAATGAGDPGGDAGGEGIPGGEWLHIRIDPHSETATVNGEGAGTVTVTGWSPGAEVGLLTLALDGAGSGRLLIDEVHWQGSRAAATMVQRTRLSARPDWSVTLGPVAVLSDIALDQEVILRSGDALDGSFTNGSVTSRSSLGAQLPLAGITGRTTAGFAGDVTRLSAGHTVIVPSAGFPVRITDVFDTTLIGGDGGGSGTDTGAAGSGGTAHRSDARIRLRGTEVLRGEASVREDADGIRRDWNVSATSGDLVPGSPRAVLRLSDRRAPGADDGVGGSYVDGWTRSGRLYLPGNLEDATNRRAGAEASFSYTDAVVGTAAGAEASLDHQIATRREDALTASVSLPISLRREAPTAIRMTPTYMRSLRLIRATTTDPGPTGDVADYGESVWSQYYARRAPPFGELFLTSLREDFTEATTAVERARYRAEASAEVEGNAGTRPIYLLLPSSGRLTLARSLEREESAVSDLRETSLLLRSAAINLFGRVGARPIMDLYRTDEYRLQTEFSRRRSLSPPGHTSSISGSLDGRFFGDGEAALTVVPEVAFTWTEAEGEEAAQTLEPSLEATFTWGARRVPEWSVPVISQPVTGIVNTEQLAAEATWKRAPGELDATLVASHISAVQFSEHGEISFGVDVGIGRESGASGNGPAAFLGFQGTLGGTLRF
ncbi:MAG: hypothetical protein ACLFO1_02610 [Spirochaetaceae bacterium]